MYICVWINVYLAENFHYFSNHADSDNIQVGSTNLNMQLWEKSITLLLRKFMLCGVMLLYVMLFYAMLLHITIMS